MKYKFTELVDVPRLQELTDDLYKATGIPSAIIDMDGVILTGSGWQRICTDFHRRHPQIEKECIKSDISIHESMKAGEPFAMYKCPRGLVDAASPVVIDGEHVANVFAGQLFTDPPNASTEEFFREQAQKFGFDEAEYIKAFREIPVYPFEEFCDALRFLAKFAKLVADIGLARQRELETMATLRESEERLRLALQAADQGLFDLNVQTGDAVVSAEYALMLGYDPNNFKETNAAWIERLHPDDHDSVARAYQAYIKGEIAEYRIEFRQRTKSGDWKWILSLGKIVERDSAGRPVRMLGTHTDISERKEAEAKVQQQIGELKQWHELTLGRENRILELKREVNELLKHAGKPPRY